ncbi:MAG TPA: amino acid ABC transporter permease [Limnobacter sp.]|uniref:amino acid ABC transporter permease n=1 Tax=Limnobacter sp. TaxID=2003368 RepID=UPI002E3086AC|nr:amino acid ABC transporter permease [Limnobacter sp.]HEX5485630.1 amino acid ABC transporter permease [Limnobacter sp.]
MNSGLNWAVFFQPVVDGEPLLWYQTLISGLYFTLALSIVAGIIAFVVGSLIGVFRTTSSKKLVFIGNAYVEIFRNIPLIVQFFLWYFVVPEFIPPLKEWSIRQDPTLVQFVASVVCLGLFTASRVAEQVKSGIQSLSRGQRAAGYALGLTEFQTYRHVLLPMAYRIIVPPLTSEAMNLIKNSSVALTIGLTELTFQTKEMGENTFRFIEVYIVATVIYATVAMTVNRVMVYIEKKTSVPGYISGGK